MTRQPGIVCIALGNPHRGDDAAGPHILKRLRDRLPSTIPCLMLGDDLTQLIEHLRDVQTVFLIDAYHTTTAGAPDILRLEITPHTLQQSHLPAISSHNLCLKQVLETALALHRRLPFIVFYGIRGRRFTHGAPLSPSVQKALSKVTDQITAEVHRRLRLQTISPFSGGWKMKPILREGVSETVSFRKSMPHLNPVKPERSEEW